MRRFATLLVASFIACGPGVQSDPTFPIDAGSPGQPSAPNPIPVVVSHAPTSAAVGSASFLLTVTGANFLPTSVVRWNGLDRATAFIDPSELRAAILDSDLASAGTVEVTVVNPLPGGGSAGPLGFEVRNRVPTLGSFFPGNVVFGSPDFTLTVSGTNFVSTSVVRWNGADRVTTFVSKNQIQATVPASEVAAIGTASITVFNPAPGGGASNSFDFSIENPRPLVTSISPDSAVAGEPSFTLTVNGTGFLPGSVVIWTNTELLTTFISSTRLSATTRCADLANGVPPFIIVSNPPPGGGFSPTDVPFTVLPPPGGVGVIEQISVAPSGNVVAATQSSISPGGRFVAFTSNSTELVPAGTIGDVFVRDRCVGGPADCVPSTTRVSVANDGSPGNGRSFAPSMSAGGRFVTFLSQATNLVAGDTNLQADVFVRDTCRGAPPGCVASTIRASVQNNGQGGEANSDTFPSPVSADGRFVAFTAVFRQIGQPVADVFVRDTCAGAPSGCVPSTTVASVTSDGFLADDRSDFPSMSADGRFIAFSSKAAFLVPADKNAASDVFVRDTCQGVPSGCVPSTTRVSMANDGSEGNGGSGSPSISADGRFVAFLSNASNLVAGDTNFQTDLFVRDTCAGASSGCVASTTRVPLASDNGPINPLFLWSVPSISSSGRFVAFDGLGGNLAACANSSTDVFVADTCIGAPAGCTISKVRVSQSTEGIMGNGDSAHPSLSADGRLVAFESVARNGLQGLFGGPGAHVSLARTGF
jgi:Tol biopolymer transport system component